MFLIGDICYVTTLLVEDSVSDDLGPTVRKGDLSSALSKMSTQIFNGWPRKNILLLEWVI